MFALWYLSLGVDEIRKRCHGAPLILTQKTAAEGPKKEVPAAKPKADPVPPKPAPPIQPLKPIEIPKDSDSERLKQLESPETVELIKSFEKINGDQSNGEGNSSSSKKEDIKQDPVVPIKKPEPKTPEPKKPEPKKPSPQIEVPSKPPANPEMAFPGMKPKADTLKKDLKDATQSFLAEELGGGGGQPKQAKRNKSDTMVDAAVLEKLEAGFAKLAASDSKSLLKKYLTKAVFDSLKNKKTSFGSTLLDCIQSGLENHDSGVGIYAPDAESYTVFADLFDPIIEDYHGGFKKTDKHPAKDLGDTSTFGNLDPNSEFVISTRVRCGRSMEGYPFNPCLTEAQYKEMEGKVSSTLSGLEGELKGTFYPLTGMEKTVQQQLIDDHFLFKEGDRFLQAANACRFWPSGRGIFHNDAKTFLVWCNEEDHLRIISMQMGGDLGQVYRRLVNAINDIEKRIPFSHNDRLGFLTFCPTNLGTTIRASVHIKVPKLAANKAKLEEVAAKYNLQVRGTRGEHTEAEGGVYDISNKRRMGLTEYEAVKEMYDGIAEIIKIEKSL